MKKSMSEFLKTELDSGDLDLFTNYLAKWGKSYVNKVEFMMRLWEFK